MQMAISLQMAALYHRACEGGDAIGCTNLGDMYAIGIGVRQESAQAAPGSAELVREGILLHALA